MITPLIDLQLQPDSYAFRPGLGVTDAVAAVQDRIDDGADQVVRTDFTSCFDRVPRAAALSALVRHLPDPTVVRILARCVYRPGSKGIPQGAPLSPLIVNAYLDGLDRALWDHGVDPIRYADDIAIPQFGRHPAQEALKHLRRLAPQWGMTLSIVDTRIYTAEEGVPFLGRTIHTKSASQGKGEPTKVGLRTPKRVTIYVTEPRSVLRARGEKFVFSRTDSTTVKHPAARTRQVVCTDRVLISSAALALAARTGINVAVTNRFDGMLGRFGADTSVSKLRVAQVLMPKKDRLAAAREIVRVKILNQRTLLQRTAARRAIVAAEIPAAILKASRQVHQASSVPVLMGIEGSASRTYFRGLTQLVDPCWSFRNRNRRPPKDPVNAMLSYSYTMLVNEARTAIELTGLDPTLGLLHEPWRGRASLALDLMEEFRALLVDTVILRVIATRAVRPDQFTSGPNGCRMDLPARRSIVTAFEQRLLTVVKHPHLHQKMTYREVIHAQAHAIAHVITHPDSTYRAMPWR